jgi:hypothetical protein
LNIRRNNFRSFTKRRIIPEYQIGSIAFAGRLALQIKIDQKASLKDLELLDSGTVSPSQDIQTDTVMGFYFYVAFSREGTDEKCTCHSFLYAFILATNGPFK